MVCVIIRIGSSGGLTTYILKNVSSLTTTAPYAMMAHGITGLERVKNVSSSTTTAPYAYDAKWHHGTGKGQGKEMILTSEGGSCRSQYVESLLWKRLWTCLPIKTGKVNCVTIWIPV